jgi:hypothetical protein
MASLVSFAMMVLERRFSMLILVSESVKIGICLSFLCLLLRSDRRPAASVDNNLARTFPVEFAKFTGLKRIALPSNSVTGTIPLDISKLSELALFEMDFNPGSGGFLPSSLFQLPLLCGWTSGVYSDLFQRT